MVVEVDANLWVDKYFKMFYRYAYSRIQDSSLASDMVQDTFLAGLNGLDRFEGKSTVKTWLFSILKRKIIDYWRMQGTRKTLPFAYYQRNDDLNETQFEDLIQSDGLNGESVIENKELKEKLFSTIYALPEKWIPIVIDRLINEKSCEDICEIHNVSVSNVWVIMYRAKNQLRKGLQQTWMNANA